MSHNLSHCIVTTDTKVRREAVCGSHQAGGDNVISSYSRLVLVFRDTFLLSIFVTSEGVRWKVLRKNSIMWASVTIFPPARSQYTQYPPLLGMKVWPRVPLLGYLARRSPCHSADTGTHCTFLTSTIHTSHHLTHTHQLFCQKGQMLFVWMIIYTSVLLIVTCLLYFFCLIYFIAM